MTGADGPAGILAGLDAARCLRQILCLLRRDGRQAIGCDALFLVLREQGALRMMGGAGIAPDRAASLLAADGAVARAIAGNRPETLAPDGALDAAGIGAAQLVIAPFAATGASGALVALRRRSPPDGADPLAGMILLAHAVAEALARARLLDGLPHLLFTMRRDGRFEPLGRLWFEYGLEHDETRIGPARLAALLHPDERLAVLRHWAGSVASGARIEIEHRLRHRDGRYRWFRTLAAPDAVATGALYIGTGTEIDGLVQARAEERQNRAAMERRLADESADRGRTEARLAKAERIEAVGQLTSGVAHDFNNLLTVIIGNLEFLEASACEGGGLDGTSRARLAAMREAAERGGALTRQLLAFARRQRLEPRPTGLNDVVAELQGLLPAATGGGIAVQTALQDGLWPAFVDRTQIERMILNLARNAHEAMEVGGALTIATANRPVDAAEAESLGLPAAGDYVEISVSDTGRGMESALLKRAFEPFFTTKPPGKGSGLGLAQVYGFARQSGGIVTLHSVAGEGTRVAILLPRASPAPAHPAPASAPVDDAPDTPPRAQPAGFLIPPLPDAPPRDPAGTPDRRLVLLVDDDLAVRDVTSTIVAEAGFRVVEAASGQEAIERLAELGRVDLMVTDYAMPGMNGHELSRAATSHQPDIKVLFVTGYADLTALAEVPEQRILLKPFRGATLLDKIGGVLAG